MPKKPVTITKSYLVRLYPTKEQTTLLNKTFGCNRYVHNLALEQRIQHNIAQRELPKEQRKYLTYADQSKYLTSLKGELEWLKEVDSTALQSSLKNVDAAYKNYLRAFKTEKKVGYPRKKKR